MLELRRDDLQLFIIHYSFFCVCFVLLYMGKFEFKIDSKNDSKIGPKYDSKLHSKKTPDCTTCFATCRSIYNSGKYGREINHLCFITMHGFIFLLVCIYKWKGTRLKQGREKV